MTKNKNTKIIATLGPASSTQNIIEGLHKAGADIFRLNLSHGTHADHRNNFEIIRNIEKKYNTSIGILMDLQGPKHRIGTFNNGKIELNSGDNFRLKLQACEGNKNQVHLPHEEIFSCVNSGDTILLDDGQISLNVIEITTGEILTKVVDGGILSNNKGVNLPDTKLSITPITEKDRADIKFALELGADFIGLSFVQSPEDIKEAKELIGDNARITSKIEKPEALKNIDEIIALSDTILVARGDLGVEMLPEDVPTAQKNIVKKCRESGKPVAIATQMLESMTTNPRPTRAEVSDVANAVYDGADAVMLSAESAAGKYPVKSVELMSRIIEKVEHDPSYLAALHSQMKMPEATSSDAITSSAVRSAYTIGAKAILSFTSSGRTSLRVARQRPPVPIIGITESYKTSRSLCFAWGVIPVISHNIKTYAEMVDFTPILAKDLSLAEKGDSLILTAGEPIGVPGGTNLLKILKV